MTKKENKSQADLTSYHPALPNHETTKMFSGMSEREVLSVLIKNQDMITDVIKYIPTSKVFYYPDHEKIWKSMYALYKSNKTIDVATICNHLSEKGFKLTYYVTGLEYVTTANLQTHAKIVYDLYVRRQLYEKIMGYEKRLRELSSYKDVSTDINLLSKMAEKFQSAISLDEKSMGAITEDLEKSIFEKKNLIQTGIGRVDRAIVGMTKGEISIVAGRPGNGKSTFVLNVVKNLVLDGKKVMLISREMPNVEIIKKFIAMHTKVKNRDMRSNAHKYKDEIKKGLEFVKKHYKSLHLFDNLRTLDEALNEAKRIQPDVIIDDHIGFIEFPHYDKQDVRHRIAEITRRYKWLAKEIDCCVILVSQLNRNIEHRVDKIPRLSDLAESGNLEQDAEIVIFNYYPYVYEYENAEHGEYGTQLIVAKNRYGTTCKFDLGYDGDSASILDSPEEAKAKSEGRALSTEEYANTLF